MRKLRKVFGIIFRFFAFQSLCMMLKMDDLIANFTNQLKRAVEIGESARLKKNKVPFRNVLVSGLGGSGIGGTIISNVLRDDISIPIIVNKEYQIPAFVNESTLVIISSYSGNTEETLTAMMQALKKGAHVVCITSGGLVKEYAELNKIDVIQIDGGMPPRSCLGLSFVQLLYVLHYLDLIKDGFKANLKKAVDRLDSEQDEIRQIARSYATRLHGKIPVIYSDAAYEGVSIRFRQQINENSKMLCWHHVLPEMNHNELVGWVEQNDNIAVIFLRNNNDFERNQERMEFTKQVVKTFAGDVMELYSKGDTDIERSLYLVHACDWISYYLSELHEVDAIEVNVITKLKNKLAEKPL
jgi:glucose/mannose-6-phosphate isomerase